MILEIEIERAMNRYFKEHNKQQNGKWHFLLSEDIRSHAGGSQVMRRLQAESSKLSFMNK